MLFDHGCDAITSVINPALIMRLMNADMGPYQLFTFMIGCFPFYLVTVEAYHTGYMIMTEINGVSEASIVHMAVCFYAAYHGNNEELYT